jgi:hypothetical protein
MVSNDTGVRLVEAKITMTLQEFLGLEENEKAEAELVSWMDIDEQNPQFSPLLYVQVCSGKGAFVCLENGFEKITFQIFICLLVIRKIDQQKILFS